uniref:Uncharacterized protein n=1 Tax=Oryza meridionalis TaxID=40149 RepID=A0A0E0F9Q6_9ORYZ
MVVASAFNGVRYFCDAHTRTTLWLLASFAPIRARSSWSCAAGLTPEVPSGLSSPLPTACNTQFGEVEAVC